jgi:murein DD-endopeptidase MepM/ murein hydrolase activator NlpD
MVPNGACGQETQREEATEISGAEAAYVERVQEAQQQGSNGNAVPKPDHFTMNLDGWSNPTGKPERGCDSGGCGNYGARRNEGLGATHRGADYLGTVGQDVFAPRTGLISSIGYAYPNSSLRMIHLSTYDGYSIGIGYASPATGIHSGSFVMSGQAIGIMQNVQDVVGSRTPPHIHIQIDFNGTRINPEPLIPAPFQMTF